MNRLAFTLPLLAVPLFAVLALACPARARRR